MKYENKLCPFNDDFEDNLKKFYGCPLNCTCQAYLEIHCNRYSFNKFPIRRLKNWKIIRIQNLREINQTGFFFSNLNYKTTELEIFNTSLQSFDGIRNLKNLIKLNLTNNIINYFSKVDLTTNRLQTFILSQNKLLNIDEKNILLPNTLLNIQLKNIRFFYLAKLLKNLKNLSYLNFENSSFFDFTNDLMNDLVNLKFLNIKYINLKKKDFNKEHFKNLPNGIKILSSKNKYCCYLKTDNEKKDCFQKSNNDINTCNQLINSNILKGNIYFRNK